MLCGGKPKEKGKQISLWFPQRRAELLLQNHFDCGSTHPAPLVFTENQPWAVAGGKKCAWEGLLPRGLSSSLQKKPAGQFDTQHWLLSVGR